jgi:NAD-dependent dihydropyrimidine dehydrogenase PreA subunit
MRPMPVIDADRCDLCGDCVLACPNHAVSLKADDGLVLDEEACAYCGDCEDICPQGAIRLPYDIRGAASDSR